MFVRKNIFFIFVSIISFGSLLSIASANTLDFGVKRIADTSYSTTISNVSSLDTDLTFQFTGISTSGGFSQYSINLPSGFTYQSGSTSTDTCGNSSTISQSNANYQFSFSGSANCMVIRTFTYRVTSTASWGTQTISLLEKSGSTWNSLNSVSLGIIATNSITKAVTADLNSNGYIDAYVLSFASGGSVTINSLSWITVAGSGVTRSAAYSSGTNWILPFTDSILGTGVLPQIGGIFDGATLTNSTISEEDGARPRIMTIAGSGTTSLTGVTISPIYIGTGVLTMGISEPLSSNSTGSFSLSLGTGTVAGTMSLTGNLSTLLFTPTSALVMGTYTLSNTTGATDWSAAKNILSQTFPSLIVRDSTAPTGGSISINSGATTTTSQTVTLTLSASDNIGVTEMIFSNSSTFGSTWETYATSKTWNLAGSAAGSYTVYVKFRDAIGNESAISSSSITIPSSGGGWWGGGGGGGSISSSLADTCPLGDKSGNIYDGKCTAPILTTTGTLNSTGSSITTSGPSANWISPLSPVNSLSISTIDVYYFTGINAAKSYLATQIQDARILALAEKYATQLLLGDELYYPSIDPSLFVQYNQIINAYTILFLRIQDAVSGNRSDIVRADGRQSYGIVNNGLTFAKNYLDRYVNRNHLTEKDITMYKTKVTALEKPLSILEGKVLAKFDLLLSSETITREEYTTGVQAYNDFVLHLSIYRSLNQSSIVKNRAMDAIKIFSAIYAKKVLPKIEPTLDPTLLQKQQSYLNTSSLSQKIGDIYIFSRDLKSGDMNEDVRNLQTILKSYGYFGTLNPTSYFGPSTKAYLTRFSKEILQINNPDGLFDAKIREAIVRIEVK